MNCLLLRIFSNRTPLFIVAFLIFHLSYSFCAEHVFIVVIDGVRYSESFGSEGKYIPHMWNELRPQGTIFTNFRNDGTTTTCPGHASMLTGVWQKIANDGTEPFHDPTIFELFRKQKGMREHSCFVVSGKAKLHVLTHSADATLGAKYQAALAVDDSGDNIRTWQKLSSVMDQYHPHVVIINFAETDLLGHAGAWSRYLTALREIDSIIGLLWKRIQSDSVYKNTTTMFVTNDHGRHDDQHGGFKNHGDSCEGCRHIMLLAIGPHFSAGKIIDDKTYQIDIAPTAAELLGIKIPTVQGRTLLRRRDVEEK